MRICLYTETALPMLGGQELTVDALARQFKARGHDVVVLAPTPRSPLRADDGALPYRVVRHPRFISTRYGVAWYRWFLHRLHRRFAFDVLHCHSVYPTGYLGVLSRERLNAPVVITSHGGDVDEGSRLLRKPGLPGRHAFAVKEADALVAISGFVRDGYRRLHPGATPRDIPNGVDVTAYAQSTTRPINFAADIAPREYFLFLGRLSRRKGVDVLLDALATLSEAERPRVLLAGGGEERAELEQRSVALALGDRVRFLGQVTGPAKIWLLQNAIATVLPSRDWEAFPLVVLESFAAGTPVIVTRIPGLRDLVEPGRTGWLAEPESPRALGLALHDIAADVPGAKRMGETARDHTKAHDWTLVAARYLALYDEVIERGATRHGGEYEGAAT